MALTMKALQDQIDLLKKEIESIKMKNEYSVLTKKLEIGDSFKVAGLMWKILDITEKGYVCLAEKLENKMQFDSSCNNWQGSNLRNYLNTKFLEKLEKEAGARNIVPFERDLLSLDGQTEYGTCEDKVSLLTVDEYRKYRAMIPNADYWWWLITPWSTPCNGYEKLVTVVSGSGYFNYYYCSRVNGVRPFCIFSSSIFESEE